MFYSIREKALQGNGISRSQALSLTLIKEEQVLELVSNVFSATIKHRKNSLELCSIVNAKSGGCSEDCSFCAQSSRYGVGLKEYPMISPEKILRHAAAMEKAGVKRFSLVTSGRGIAGRDLEAALATFDLLKRETSLSLCASLGIIDQKKAFMLKEAGVTMYHHNLEAASGFFNHVCTTHSHQDRVSTIKAARKSGLRVCSGGIIGLGESFENRIDLAFEIKDLGIDSIPINFLTPIHGTPLQNVSPPPPLELIQTLAIFRLILPGAIIRLCGGRANLRSLEALAFIAGADGVMVGDYLTTKGKELQRDIQMISDLGLKISRQVRGNAL